MVAKLGAHQDFAINEVLVRDGLYVQYGTGTGKTRIMLEAAHALYAAFSGLVLLLVPNSVLQQTLEEARRWLPESLTREIVLLDGSATIRSRAQRIASLRQGLVILSHEALSYAAVANALASRSGFTAVFIDEMTRFRNWSNRTRALLRLSNKAARRYGFSGTPIVKGPQDLWYPMKFLVPGWCGPLNKRAFLSEYCILGGWSGSEVIGVRGEKIETLHHLLDQHRITCKLSDIRDMPPRVMQVRQVDLSSEQRRRYAELRDTLRLEIERTSDTVFSLAATSYGARLQRLQEIAAGFARNTDGEVVHLPSAKTDELLELLTDPTPTIVWTWWVPEYEATCRALDGAGISYSTLAERQDFLDGKTNVLVAQMASGGYGLNLERADRMIYHSLSWDLELVLQSLERNWRLTTSRSKVVVQLVAKGTVDEYVRERMFEKATVAGTLTRSEALDMLAVV